MRRRRSLARAQAAGVAWRLGPRPSGGHVPYGIQLAPQMPGNGTAARVDSTAGTRERRGHLYRAVKLAVEGARVLPVCRVLLRAMPAL